MTLSLYAQGQTGGFRAVERVFGFYFLIAACLCLRVRVKNCWSMMPRFFPSGFKLTTRRLDYELCRTVVYEVFTVAAVRTSLQININLSLPQIILKLSSILTPRLLFQLFVSVR